MTIVYVLRTYSFCTIKLVYVTNKFISSYRNMDASSKRVLKKCHQRLRTGLLVDSFLPALRLILTDVEYSRVEGREDNVARVDKLIEILLTKENWHFEGFCAALENNGYELWAMKLRGEVDEDEGKLICLHVLWSWSLVFICPQQCRARHHNSANHSLASCHTWRLGESN